ncbi:DEAD/DEAH box helicase family protein, partial [Vibrio parahaemolyticus V-223/04]
CIQLIKSVSVSC